MNALLATANGLSWSDLASLFGHFMLLSVLSIGGALSSAPEMHRLLVDRHGWLTDSQFTASIALAQAAPGPNILFVAVLGWNTAGVLGALACLVGILLPASTIALTATRWSRKRRDTLFMRAFMQGMAPMTIGLLLSTGWLLSEPAHHHLGAAVLTLATVVVSWRTRVSPLWLIGCGAVAGALGWV